MDFFFEQLELGPMANYVYLLGDPKAKLCAVVDPGWEAKAILERLAKEDYRLSAIFATHNHFDHVGAIPDLLKAADVPVYVNKADAGALRSVAGANLKAVSGGDKVVLGSLNVELLHTPGHTAGSQCLAVHNRLLTGDTLFIDGCGRVDLPTSNPEEMAQSLCKISELPSQTVVWPGHNYSDEKNATIAAQARSNSYLAAAKRSLEDFLSLVGS